MDPLTAIGLASSVVQFIDFGLKVVKRLDEFNSRNPGEVPRSLQTIATQLPLLINALNRVKTDSAIKNLDFDTKCILRGMVSGCLTQIVEVDKMMNEISLAPGDSFKVKAKKVFTSLKYDDKVRDIERNLHTYISVLILHHVVDSAEAPLELVDDTFFDVREKRVSPFVERPSLMEELDNHFHDATRSQVQNPTILLLEGDKGVGKTQLALEYCHQAHSLGQFRSVFWIDASTLENLCLGFESMYATIKRSMVGNRKEKIAFVREFLNDLWHPWLLVLDNYEPAELYNDIMEILPHRGYGGILLITRDQAHDGLGKVIQVPKFITAEDQKQLNSLLVQEVQRENFEGIKDLVNQGADVNSLIWNEWPVLHRVALFGLEDAVTLLLERGANPNPPLKIRKPLYWAASGGHESVCRLLLDYEDATEPICTPADNQAAFNEAVEKGSLGIVRMISTRREVKFNSKNQYDETPLQSAAKNGFTEMLKFLIDQGALIEDHLQGDHALIRAAGAGHLEIVKILCSEGKVNPNVQDGQGRTALCYAAGLKKDGTSDEGGEEMATFLLEKGADPNLCGKSEAPLHEAASHGHLNMIRILLEHNADPIKDCNGWSPLTTAIKYSNPEVITLLLQAKISDADLRTTWLERALRYACRKGDRAVVLQLLKAGANIDAVEEDGFPKGATPLLLAILDGHVKVAQLLIRQGARQGIADEKGRFPLPLAAENGYDLVVRDLIRAGGEPNLKSGENEDTPLILAAGLGHEKVVKVLLENGADKELVNKFGELALDIAEEKTGKAYEEIVKLLEG
jgi:ankyrin repeat protein